MLLAFEESKLLKMNATLGELIAKVYDQTQKSDLLEVNYPILRKYYATHVFTDGGRAFSKIYF
jgi:hypothetical protein